MFNDIGKKIKGLAIFVAVVGIAASIITGFVLLSKSETGYDYYAHSKIYDKTMVKAGLVLLFGGPLLSWAGSLLTYGFGELIEKTCSLEKKMQNGARTDDTSVEGDLTTATENVTDSTSTPTEEETKEKP